MNMKATDIRERLKKIYNLKTKQYTDEHLEWLFNRLKNTTNPLLSVAYFLNEKIVVKE